LILDILIGYLLNRIKLYNLPDVWLVSLVTHPVSFPPIFGTENVLTFNKDKVYQVCVMKNKDNDAWIKRISISKSQLWKGGMPGKMETIESAVMVMNWVSSLRICPGICSIGSNEQDTASIFQKWIISG
jgi:hypothetical protein